MALQKVRDTVVQVDDQGDGSHYAATELVVGGALVTAAAPLPVQLKSGGSSQPVTVADGADVVEGTTTDAAITSSATGTISGKLRGLVAILADVWSSVYHLVNSAVQLANVPVYSLQYDQTMAADADVDSLVTLRVNGLGALRHYVRPQRWNGATWDKDRNNVAATVLASASRTATTNGSDLTSYNGRRLALIVNVSDASGGGSVTPSLQLKDSVSGNYVTVWTAAAAITTATTAAYLFGPSESGGSWTQALPFGVPGRTFRFVFTANNASALVYSASCEVMV